MEIVVVSLLITESLHVYYVFLFKHLVKKKTKRRSQMMTAPVPQSLSQLSWVQHYGTRHCHMMETLSSWNTWTWKNSSQKMAFHPAQTSTSLAHTSQVSSKLPQHHLLSWTSAAGLLLQSIQAWCRRTACRARSDQVNQSFPVEFGVSPSSPLQITASP